MKSTIVAAACAWGALAWAQHPAADSARRPNLVLSIHADAAASPDAPDFFAVWQKTLGATTGTFPIMTGVGASFSIDLSRSFCVLLGMQALSVTFEDAGTVEVRDTTSPGLPPVVSSEQWTSQTYPVQAGLRYTPVRGIFQSYVFCTAGAAFTHVRWDYAAQPAAGEETYPAAASFEQTEISPTATLGAGMELRFDQFHTGALLRGVMLEVCYRWVEQSFAAYHGLADASAAPLPQWRNSYNINFGGVEVRAGVNFELSR